MPLLQIKLGRYRISGSFMVETGLMRQRRSCGSVLICSVCRYAIHAVV